MTILVTGGAGFVGSRLVSRLLHDGHVVYVLARRCPAAIDARAAWLAGDLTDPRVFESLPERIDGLCHLAAVIPELPEPAVSSASAVIQPNLVGLYHALQYARRARPQSFVFASSASVYKRPAGRLPVDEEADLNPVGAYTWSKLLGERILDSSAYGDIPFRVALRCSSIYGAGQRPTSVLPQFVNQRLAGQPITLFGEGTRSQDFVHVDDLCDAIVRLVEARHLAGSHVFNAGSGCETSMRDLAETICAVFNPEAAPELVVSSHRQDDDDRFVLGIRRLQNAIGFQPRTIREGLEDVRAAVGGVGKRACASL